MSDASELQEAIAVYVEQLIRGLLNMDERHRRRGKTNFLDEQVAAFEAKAKACRAPDCPSYCGCTTLLTIMNRIEQERDRRNPSLPGLEPGRDD